MDSVAQPSPAGEPDTVPSPILDPVESSRLLSEEPANPALDSPHAGPDLSAGASRRSPVSAAQPANVNSDTSADVASTTQPTNPAPILAASNDNTNADSSATGESAVAKQRTLLSRLDLDSQQRPPPPNPAPSESGTTTRRKPKGSRRKTPILSDSEGELPSEPKRKRKRLGWKPLFLPDSEEEEAEPEFEVDEIIGFGYEVCFAFERAICLY